MYRTYINKREQIQFNYIINIILFCFIIFSGGQSGVIFNYENKCNDLLWLGASPSIGDSDPQQDPGNFVHILMNGKVAFGLGTSALAMSHSIFHVKLETGLGTMSCQPPPPALTQ